MKSVWPDEAGFDQLGHDATVKVDLGDGGDGGDWMTTSRTVSQRQQQFLTTLSKTRKESCRLLYSTAYFLIKNNVQIWML